MSDLPAASLTWLATHHGVITAATLTHHKVGRRTRERLVASGALRLRAKYVYTSGASPATLEQRCAVLCAAHPGGFVTGPTAGQLAALRRMPRSAAIHFSVIHGHHHLPTPGVTWRQTTRIEQADRATRDDGIVVASWSRLAFDLAVNLAPLDHLSVVNQLLDERKATADELWAVDRRLGHPGRPGSGPFRRTLEALGGDAPRQSHPEVVLGEALRQRGIPVESQVAVMLGSGRRPLHVDLGVRTARWGVELDIHPEHRSWEGHASDASRRRDLHRVAWQIETVSEHDMRDVDRLADELADLYAVRERAIRPHPSVS
jgi:hypothetical protein